jgi:high affinity Mn2+ porin
MRSRLLASAAVLVLALGEARGEQPSKTLAFNWTGFYTGGHLGYAWGGSDWVASSPGGRESGSLDFFEPYDWFTGTGSYFLGIQAGYNSKLPSGMVIGFQADVAAPSSIADTQTRASATIGQASYGEKVEISGTLRGRLGFLHNNWLLYGTAGYAWTFDQFVRTQLAGTPIGGTAQPGDVEKRWAWRNGWVVGAGVEVPVAAKWTFSMEYLFTAFDGNRVTFAKGAQTFDADLALQSLRVGLNYQFGDGQPDDPRGPTAPKSDHWALHAQTTYVQQYAFPFHAPYTGPHSLISDQTKQTWDATFYLGWKLWSGAEFWINPEIDQGFGLSGTVGVAGYPSGEAYKLGATYPYARLPRYFLRQTVGLGGETEEVEAGINQFGGKQTKDRLVATIGKFSVTDVFDTNKYAHDPRVDFLNWAFIDTGSFDYAADAWGLTYGAAFEWYSGAWTLRAGLFDLPIVPNSTDLDPTFQQFQWVAEIERRYQLWGQPGRAALTGFLTEGRMGLFEDAVKLANLTGQPADIATVRHFQSRLGISFNLEQQIFRDYGVFVRAGWADGRFEPFAFTDIDRTVAVGLVVSGKQWGRPEDTFGLAAVHNEISREHQAYLNAGGLTGLLGDGKLPHHGPEGIIEMYYSFPLLSWRMTLDYQFIDNPGYNKDRGPVSIIGTRLRAQF